MVFCDLMNRLKTTELNTMNASTILHNMLRAVTPNSIHKARFNTLVAAVKSLLHCQQSKGSPEIIIKFQLHHSHPYFSNRVSLPP
ncbi:hypothetical protein, partial [Pseudoalteromonas prydzensis]|uniref:hypothetical protein n=1 Tax=Pseudoalteromonas prydzensis TaxID=182141 RepID=UPI001CE46AA8